MESSAGAVTPPRRDRDRSACGCVRSTMADAEALNAIQSDPHHMRFYPHPFSMQESREWIERMHERSERDGFALLAVEDRETGEFLGQRRADPATRRRRGRGGARVVDHPDARPAGDRHRGGVRVSRLGLRDVADRPRDLADPSGQHAVARRGREPRDDGVEAGSVGDAEAADPPGVPAGPSRRSDPSERRGARAAVRRPPGRSRGDRPPRSGCRRRDWTRRGRAGPAAGRRSRPPRTAAAASRNA